MIRVAVVGAGIMGANHARVLHRLPDAEVTLVVDPDEECGRALAGSVDAQWAPDPGTVPELADAAVVATPTADHAAVGVRLLRAGVDLLVEKPIAGTLEDATRLVDAAEDHGRLLAIGHIERFNPAVLELERLVDDPVHIELTRIGPFSPRVSTDVVLDLMIHDLDLALMLARSEVVELKAVGRCVRTDGLDVATALLRFANGVTATVSSSRVAQTKVRSIEITQRENFVTVDLVRQDLAVHRVTHNEFLSEGGARYRQSGLLEIPFLEQRGEPLGLELGAFLDSVATHRTPRVTGEQGRRALELALRVRELAGHHAR